MNKLYEGTRSGRDVRITVDGQPLNMRNDIRDHSPTGGSWGYRGSDCAQLALASLADATGDDTLAQQHYQDFKDAFIAGIETDTWIITQAEVRCWIASVLANQDPEPDA